MAAFDFLTDLFGGSKSTTAPTTAQDITPPEFAGLRPDLASWLSTFLQTAGPEPTGPLVAPLTEGQTSAIGDISGAAFGPNPTLDAANTLTTKTLEGGFLPGASGGNPFLDAVIEAVNRPLIQNFEESIVPQLLSRFMGRGQEVQGQGSSAFAREGRLAGENQQQLLADTAAKLGFGAFEAERGRQAEAVTQATGLSQEQMSRMTTGLQAVSLPQLVQDLGIQRGLAEFDRRMTTLLDVIKQVSALSSPAGVSVGGGTTSRSSTGIIPTLFP